LHQLGVAEVREEAVTNRRELFVAGGFAGASAIAHLVWNPIVAYWQFVATTLLFVAGLTLWLVKEWRQLRRFITKFYCIAVIFDIFAEGILQPFHHCTAGNLMCTGRLFLVFFLLWLVTHRLEKRNEPRMPSGLVP
jgi:hypothetical protein